MLLLSKTNSWSLQIHLQHHSLLLPMHDGRWDESLWSLQSLSLKFGGQQIITQTRRNSRGPSYRSVFLLPVFVTLDCLLFPGPPCVTSFLPVPTLGKNHTETTINKPPHTIFRSPNPMFLCSHARNINKLTKNKVTLNRSLKKYLIIAWGGGDPMYHEV